MADPPPGRLRHAEDFSTFGEREQQLRDFAIRLGVPAERVRVAIENDMGNGGFRPALVIHRRNRISIRLSRLTSIFRGSA